MKCRIATRESALALTQAKLIQQQLLSFHPELSVELIGITTEADRKLDITLDKIGGKGLFVKELEHALMENRADIAVHSLKDVPVELPEGLHLPVICERSDPFDAFVCPRDLTFMDLPKDAVVGTSSLRRQSQLQALRPDLHFKNLRGNVNTRLRKLDDGEFDAIILAAAGLERLGFSDRIRHVFEPESLLPAAGQGVLAIECRRDDPSIENLIRCLIHPTTALCATAERAMNLRLGGGCHVPIGAYAQQIDQSLQITGIVGQPDGSLIIRRSLSGPLDQATQIGTDLAERLLAAGADKILKCLN